MTPGQTKLIVRDGVTLVLIGAFLTITNPFGATSGLTLLGSFAYWTGLVFIGWLGGPVFSRMVARVAPNLSREINIAIATIFVALVVTGAIILVQAHLLGDPVPQSYWPTLYGLVFAISAAVAAVSWLVERAFGGAPGAVTHAPASGAAVSVRFLERLPAKIKGGALYAVSSEDHYLRLHTSKGADLILMRLSDAIVELEGLEGAQTHRSWWVARNAVESVRRDGDKVTLVLKGGVEAPVSRPNVRPLREARWF